MWGEQVDTFSPRITELIDHVGRRLTPQLWAATCRAALAADAPEDLVQGQALRWARTWEALKSWFGGANGQARRLRRQLRDLVAPWARNMHILVDTGGAVTRRGDLLRLASAIERAPTDEIAHQLWDMAVGTFPARHLLVVADARDDHTLSWAQAPKSPITTRFREQGVRAAVGRRAKSADYAKGRAAARAARAAASASRAEAEARLRQLSGSHVSTWGTLADAELDLFQELIGLTRPDDGDRSGMPSGDGDRTVRSSVGRQLSGRTSDGRWRVVLIPPEQAAQVATVESARGPVRHHRLALSSGAGEMKETEAEFLRKAFIGLLVSPVVDSRANPDLWTLVRHPRPPPGAEGYRVTFDLYIGADEKEPLHVDLVVGVIVTDEATVAAPANALNLPKLRSCDYRLYPVVDQIADKVCATLARYHGYPSSRQKDLVDLVVLAVTEDIDADELAIAMGREAAARQLARPQAFAVPDTWGGGYEKLAQDIPYCEGYRNVPAAAALPKRFIDPILDGRAAGKRWSRTTLAWG